MLVRYKEFEGEARAEAEEAIQAKLAEREREKKFEELEADYISQQEEAQARAEGEAIEQKISDAEAGVFTLADTNTSFQKDRTLETQSDTDPFDRILPMSPEMIDAKNRNFRELKKYKQALADAYQDAEAKNDVEKRKFLDEFEENMPFMFRASGGKPERLEKVNDKFIQDLRRFEEKKEQPKVKSTSERDVIDNRIDQSTPAEELLILEEKNVDGKLLEANSTEDDEIKNKLLDKQIEWQDDLWLYHDATDRAFEKFAQEHTPPADVQKLIEENKEKILSQNYLPLKGEDGSYVVVAKGYDMPRIFNADTAREIIQDNDLTSLEVPKKWVYNVDGIHKVFAEYIPSETITRKNPLNLKETQDLITFIEKTGFIDYGIGQRPNIVRDSRNGKLAFIDIEDRSFAAGRPLTSLIQPLVTYMAIDSEALEWLEAHYKKLKQTPPALTGYLPQQEKWNDDFQKWQSNSDRLENNMNDKQVDYYLPVSDQQRISRKVVDENLEKGYSSLERNLNWAIKPKQ